MSAEVTFFDYLNTILKKDRTFEKGYDFFKRNDDFKNFDPFIMCKYLYQGNMVDYANYFQKFVYVLKKEEMFKLMYFVLPKNNIFIQYNKKVKEEKKEIIEYIQKYYQVSYNRAKEYSELLSIEDKEELLKMHGLDDNKIERLLDE